MHDIGRQCRIRQAQIDTHGILVDQIDGINAFDRTAMPSATNGGVFNAHEVLLDRIGIHFATIVKQHALAQAKRPLRQFFVGLPALGHARHDGAVVVDIRQPGVNRGNGMGGVILVVPVRI